MRPQINRLPAETGKGFAGQSIDRNRPLRFRLDGRQMSGFAGDTVLSAVMASGIDTLGRHDDDPVALDVRAAPAIAQAAFAGDPQHALPMARTPAIDGMDLVTIGARRSHALSRLFLPGRTLGLHLDDPHVLDRPWRNLSGNAEPLCDLVVVGGGVAGLAAALAAARSGLSVTLVEASPHLGGHSGLFGTQEGEDSPEESMARLSAEVRASDAIRVLTATRVFALRAGLVRAHTLDLSDGIVKGAVIDLPTLHIVLATGALERLPIFHGNRLPGVTGAVAAYELAQHFGVWPGRTALVATSSSFAYRLAMLAQDVGIGIERIFDSRPRPASRFIEFTKAYGIRQFPGTVPQSVAIAKAGGSLAVHVDVERADSATTERLVVCGGWQPDLTLWHIGGGASAWSSARYRLEPQGALDGIALAGSAAGYLTRKGCIQSGADAVDILLGRERKIVEDPVIEELFETPDAATPMGPQRDDAPAAYLDVTAQLLRRPLARRKTIRQIFRRRRQSGLLALSEVPQPLAICDVAAGVDLGMIPAASAGVVAQERVALVPLALPVNDDEAQETPIEAESVPSYLVGRFGPGAQLALVVPSESRALETGALIYLNSDASHPQEAVGVVLRMRGDRPVALVSASVLHSGSGVTIRDQGRDIAARLQPWS